MEYRILLEWLILIISALLEKTVEITVLKSPLKFTAIYPKPLRYKGAGIWIL